MVLSLGAVNANWPAVSVQIAFNADPNSATTPVWTDVTDDFLSLQCSRGRDQYELGDTAAGVLNASVSNIGAKYDPANTASPYYPNVKLYRRIRVLATWAGVTHTLWSGFVERWPQSYTDRGKRGMTPLTATDVISTYAQQNLLPLLAQQMAAYNPAYYFPLDEPAGATGFADQSGNTGSPQLTATQYYSGGTYTAGSTSTLTDSVGCVTFAHVNTNSWNEVYLLRGVNNPGWANAADGFWVACWVKTSMAAPGADIDDIFLSLDNGQWNNNYSAIFFLSSTGKAGFEVNDPVNNTGDVNNYGPVINDGRWHHLAMRVSATWREYWVDGVQVLTSTTNRPWQSYGYLYLTVGGAFRSNRAFGFDGSICQVAILPYSAAFVPADVYAAGIDGFAGESSDARFGRLLSMAGQPSATVDVTGSSTEGAAAGLGGKTLIDALKQTVLDENGFMYVAGDGSLHFQGRTGRFNPSPSATFSESQIPYKEDVALDYGPEFVYNDVQITRNGGTTARVVNTASQTSYFDRTLTQTIYVATDQEAGDRASFLANHYGEPSYRVSTLTTNLAAAPSLFASVLGLELGDCVTFTRTADATISFPAFLERIEHNITPGSANPWDVSLMLSPASALTFWRLDDPVYSQLDHHYEIAY